MSDTVYIKISQSTEVHEPEVRVKDIARVHCRNKAAEARIKALKVTSFKERDREASYVGSVMDLLEELEGTGSSIQINSVVIESHDGKGRPAEGDSRYEGRFKPLEGFPPPDLRVI